MDLTVRLYTATATPKGIVFDVRACSDGGDLYKVVLLWEHSHFNRTLAWCVRVVGCVIPFAHVSILNVE